MHPWIWNYLGTCRSQIFTSKTSFPIAADCGQRSSENTDTLTARLELLEGRLSEDFFEGGMEEEGGGKLPLSCRSEGPCCSVIAD